ncbi:aminoglycoside phosphotransferase family protein [Belliella sp. DSM 111904]|uniref:Aminoglycoside phosphotransferase family protein n=1 Tax=Belliella filtrata TaxID=2923435 RepID=A0ABS9V2U4_9BACT|nr:aminoglycoside phosphotransferase family protein [Belliella filtrata]MCH7410674.1 aminoglycoside phosphotransferase family protein [Belliella filtrata]
MKLGELISSTVHAEVFLYGSNSLVKLFRKDVSSHHINREVNNTILAMNHNLPVPNVKDLINIEGRDGIVMEYIKGPTITSILKNSPHKIKTYAQKFAQLQANLHSMPVRDFSNQRQFMVKSILSIKGRLGQDLTEKILTQMNKLPDADKLCHNDFHQENIIFSNKGPIILDWQEALKGNPIADVVHALLVQEHPVPAPIFKSSTVYFQLHNKYRKLFAKFYLQEYIKLTNTSLGEIRSWVLPVAATRLFTKTSPEEKDWTEKYIRQFMKLPTN